MKSEKTILYFFLLVVLVGMYRLYDFQTQILYNQQSIRAASDLLERHYAVLVSSQSVLMHHTGGHLEPRLGCSLCFGWRKNQYEQADGTDEEAKIINESKSVKEMNRRLKGIK